MIMLRSVFETIPEEGEGMCENMPLIDDITIGRMSTIDEVPNENGFTEELTNAFKTDASIKGHDEGVLREVNAIGNCSLSFQSSRDPRRSPKAVDITQNMPRQDDDDSMLLEMPMTPRSLRSGSPLTPIRQSRFQCLRGMNPKLSASNLSFLEAELNVHTELNDTTMMSRVLSELSAIKDDLAHKPTVTESLRLELTEKTEALVKAQLELANMRKTNNDQQVAFEREKTSTAGIIGKLEQKLRAVEKERDSLLSSGRMPDDPFVSAYSALVENSSELSIQKEMLIKALESVTNNERRTTETLETLLVSLPAGNCVDTLPLSHNSFDKSQLQELEQKLDNVTQTRDLLHNELNDVRLELAGCQRQLVEARSVIDKQQDVILRFEQQSHQTSDIIFDLQQKNGTLVHQLDETLRSSLRGSDESIPDEVDSQPSSPKLKNRTGSIRFKSPFRKNKNKESKDLIANSPQKHELSSDHNGCTQQ